MSRILLKTERLLLRRWRSQDLPAFAAMCSDPETMQFIGSGSTRTVEQTKRAVINFEREWDEKGFGLFALELLETNAFIGFTGLSEPTFLPEVMPVVEIGWRIQRTHWGHGYATEAARAALDFGLIDLELPNIISIFQVENEASRKIVSKIGMRFDRQTIDPTCDRVVEVYRLSNRNNPS